MTIRPFPIMTIRHRWLLLPPDALLFPRAAHLELELDRVPPRTSSTQRATSSSTASSSALSLSTASSARVFSLLPPSPQVHRAREQRRRLRKRSRPEDERARAREREGVFELVEMCGSAFVGGGGSPHIISLRTVTLGACAVGDSLEALSDLFPVIWRRDRPFPSPPQAVTLRADDGDDGGQLSI